MRSLTNVIVGMALLLGVAAGCSVPPQELPLPEAVEPVAATEFRPGSVDEETGMVLAAENGALALYVAPETAEIAVRVKASGKLWYSNPRGREADPLASQVNEALLNSQLAITFYNRDYTFTEFNSWSHSVQREQFELLAIPDGLKVRYTLSNFERGVEELPVFISKERFEAIFLERVSSEADRELLLKRYSPVEGQDLYRRYEIARYELKDFIRILDEVGYTAEDLELDNRENEGHQAAALTDNLKVVEYLGKQRDREQIAFSVALEYRLRGDALVVDVPAGEITATPGYVAETVRVLEFFGAAGTEEEGYMLVPDGSGALIHFNNGKVGHAPFNMRVYGSEYREVPLERVGMSEQVHLPVFGLKSGAHAFLAVLEAGEALASIKADISGRLSSYNKVFSEINLYEQSFVAMEREGLRHTKRYAQQEPYGGTYRVSYTFLDDEEAGYSSMAQRYRGMLVAEEGRARLSPDSPLPFYATLVGGVERVDSVLGIPVRRVEALTDYQQVVELADRMQASGIAPIRLRYSGWANGGLPDALPARISLPGALGGERQFKAMAAALEQRGIALYPDVAMQRVYKKGAGFSVSRDAARVLDQKPARGYTYHLATSMRDQYQPFYYIVKPGRLAELFAAFREAYDPLGVERVAFLDLGSLLQADYNKKAEANRAMAQQAVIAQLQEARAGYPGLMLNAANSYALPYGDTVANIPLSGSGYSILDENVPFLAIVLSGYWDYSGAPVNEANDPELHFLRSVEAGAGLQYRWVYKSPADLMHTNNNDLYAAHYENWLEQAAAWQRRASEALAPTRGQSIASHAYVLPGVARVAYENGATITINFNEEAVRVDGMEIPARDFVGGRE